MKKHGGTLKPVRRMGFYTLARLLSISPLCSALHRKKKYNGKKEEETYTSKGLKTPFCLMSKGLGRRFAIDNSEYLQQNLGFTVQGAKCGLPRYYRDLHIRDKDTKERKRVLDVDSNDFIAKAIEKGRDLLKHYEERGLIDGNDFEWSIAQAKKKKKPESRPN